jgi:toxin YhaV
LARISRSIKSDIPANPQHPSFYQGEAQGHVYRQWRRAKPDEHHRLFFKWDRESNAIIYAWLNSEVSLAKYRSHMDAYRAFRAKR